MLFALHVLPQSIGQPRYKPDMETQRCGCGRDVPPRVLWGALAIAKGIQCSGCGWRASAADLIALVDDETQPFKLRAAVAAYVQVTRYGSTSADAIRNVIPSADARAVGGLLAGMVRAGMLQRCGSKRLSVAAMIVEKPAFVRGPEFPSTSKASA